MTHQLYLTNSLSGKKELFEPIDKHNIRMYVCGPTVYDRPHLGNARSAVVYDVLYRFLKHLYGNITYIRNITDVDDKIIDAAIKQNVTIDKITKTTTQYYHQDIGALNCLSPTSEPLATENIGQMIEMIEKLIQKGNAYIAQNHVFFDVTSFAQYGILSKRKSDDMIAGSRIAIDDAKKNPADFVLWKPDQNNSFKSPWGNGRPGWHIECSAMALRYLGAQFDIHGGGADLMFPHHENEIAQSFCANHEMLAKYWIHNGFLLVNSEKMSKSLGNFKTVRECISDGIPANAIRYLYLMSHYRKPLDFTDATLNEAKASLAKFKEAILCTPEKEMPVPDTIDIINKMCDDINTSGVLTILHKCASDAIANKDSNAIARLKFGCDLLGIKIEQNKKHAIPEHIKELAEQRTNHKKQKNWDKADQLRAQILNAGYIIKDSGDSYTIEPKVTP